MKIKPSTGVWFGVLAFWAFLSTTAYINSAGGLGRLLLAVFAPPLVFGLMYGFFRLTDDSRRRY